ncbi:unnamed protein product [Timema podura]|uniref:Uncharacterized protein n=1 Tax=Timema podura TaxID=61482 RepID=A0ABN7PA52_TIMPD|nr:unnamed protein product [Timema podura]
MTNRLYASDEVRAMFMLIQNPVFAAQSSYTIFAHLLRQMVNLPSTDHQLLVAWFKILEVEKLRMMVRHLQQFITIRQFPPADKSLPPLSKSRWWIPMATKTLALISKSTPPMDNSLQPLSKSRWWIPMATKTLALIIKSTSPMDNSR